MGRGIPAALLVLAGASGLGGQEVPPGTGLVAYWTLNDATDPTVVESANSGPTNSGTYMGAALPTTSSLVPQAFGLAHPFGNTASRVFTQATNGQRAQIPHADDLTPTGDFSVAAWVRPAGPQTENMGVVEKHGSGNGFFLRMSPTMVPRIAIASGGSTPELGAAAALTANVWSHLAATYHAGSQTLRLYVNGGTPVVRTGVAAPGANSAALHIGADYGINRFAGHIDEVRLYNRTLTAVEVGVLANGLAAPVLDPATTGPNQITLSWNPVANATSYTVYQGTSASGPWTSIATTPQTTYTDTSVLHPTSYWYQVVAVSLIESPPSAVQGPVVPQSALPRTKDHDEGFIEDRCACGSSIVSGSFPWVVVLPLALFLWRRGRGLKSQT